MKATSNPPAQSKPVARVLVVEDDLAVGAMLQIALSRSLIDATILTTGEEALRRLATETYDLILLDIRLPGMSGLEVCRQLKADPRHLRIPVIFVSGETDAARREEAMRLGAADFIEKPFNFLPLLSCIMGHLKLKANADRDRSAGWSVLRA